VRSEAITQLRRVYTYNAAKAIAVRGTASQLAMAEWLVRAATSAPRALSYAGRSLLILRGTAAQMAAAEHLVQELDKP